MWLIRSGYLHQTMKKNIIGLLLIVLCPCIAFGQQQVFTENPKRPLWILKFAPLSLIDINPTYQGAAEYFFSDKYSLQQEVGYGYEKLMPFSWEKKTDEETWRFRTEFRKYLPQRRTGFNRQRNYVAYEGMYKHFNYPVNDIVTIAKVGYYQNIHYRYQFVRDTYAVHIKFGQEEIQTSNFVVDAYLGAGFRWYNVSRIGDHPTTNDRDVFQAISPMTEGLTKAISFSLGFKIGFVAKAKTK